MIDTNLKDLIDKFKKDELDRDIYVGTDGDKNIILVKVAEELTITTCQSNGWLRKNIYYKDGTVEEMYDR